MNLLRLINPSLAYVHCSNLVSIHSLIRLIDSFCNLQANYTICFLFSLDLILYAFKILFRFDSFEILNFATK